MVDYSKWDKMEFSDSDSDNEEDNDVGPRVTALDQPGNVTIGKDGSLEIGTSNLQSSSQPRQSLAALAASSTSQQSIIPTVSGSVSGDAVDISSMEDISRSTTAQQQPQRKKLEKLREQLTRNGGEHYCIVTSHPSSLHSNVKDEKQMKLPLYWSQDRYTVTIRIGFSGAIFPTKSVHVRVTGALSYKDRYSAVGSGVMSGYKPEDNGDGPSFGSIEVVSNQNGEETVLLKGKLPRPIHLNEDEDAVDYEFGDNNLATYNTEEATACTKLVTIIMPKAVPMAGMVLWWDCPLIGYPQIDVSLIVDRNISKGGKKGEDIAANTPQQGKKEAIQQAWDQAHEMFREKMKTKEKQVIEVND